MEPTMAPRAIKILSTLPCRNLDRLDALTPTT
jgi:hypothetical protein